MHIFFKSNCSNWDIGGHSRFVAILFIWTDWGSNQGFSVFAVNINIRENRWGNLRSEYCAYKWQNESNKINTKQMSNVDPTKTRGWIQVFVEGIYIYIFGHSKTWSTLGTSNFSATLYIKIKSKIKKFYLKSVHFITVQHKLSRAFQTDMHNKLHTVFYGL